MNDLIFNEKVFNLTRGKWRAIVAGGDQRQSTFFLELRENAKRVACASCWRFRLGRLGFQTSVEFKLGFNPKQVELLRPVFEVPVESIRMGSAFPDDGGGYSVLLGTTKTETDYQFFEVKDGRTLFKIKFLPPFKVGNRAYRFNPEAPL